MSASNAGSVAAQRDDVTSFLERLADLELIEWLQIGAVVAGAGPRSAMSRALLDAVVAQTSVCVQAWQAADDVDTIARYCFAQRRTREWTALQRETAAHAVDAARVAAQAICARAYLSPAEIEELYRPFAAHIPLDQLD